MEALRSKLFLTKLINNIYLSRFGKHHRRFWKRHYRRTNMHRISQKPNRIENYDTYYLNKFQKRMTRECNNALTKFMRR